MKITDIQVTRHTIALDPPFAPSWDTRPRTSFTAFLTRIATDAGIEGISSGDDMLGFDQFKHLFIGQDPLDLERHHRILSNMSFHYARYWPLDLALWDIAGKAAGLPVWRLLGGKSGRVKLYASSGMLRDPGALTAQAQRYVDEGFGAMKLRFHRGDWRDDIKGLETVRRKIGDQLELMVDCNQGWRMVWDIEEPWKLKDALSVARELERLGVYWMEEPLFRGDWKGMKALKNMTDLRIAGGEMNRELYEFGHMIEERAVDVLQPDAALTGGITGLRRIALMCQEASVIFTPHTWSNGVGMIANAQLSAALSNGAFLEFPYDPPEWSCERRDFMMARQYEARHGHIDLGNEPGLGIVYDEKRLKKTQVE
ncbi:MAG TPA: mandelate racemase/muconate lactonizing enzyme family protein [Aestuariivirgaceae bacterium]|jgi:L-alanine-DL-glutamate epimerase-like enolase superfamily enzyme